ncbi:MAG: RNA polymerase sigma factor [Cyclobacteriaceae bacterium]
MQDKDLVRACQRNDRKAQKELYNRYKSPLMGLCLRYAASREEAEDMYQESFIKIFKNIDSLQKAESLNSWLRQTVVRTAINYYHRNKKYNWQEDTADLEIGNEDYNILLESIDNDMLLSMINQLPDGYRTVFNLHVVDGYTHPEIAKLLGVNESTSRTQLHKAKARLKEQLAVLGIKKFEKYG